ncbi:hypothetical protein L6452_43500 [Arctium lappa]|uniref:Uncharacterized protein n=1 Tax=Arctium lappa TaxID=4217 RepID=A0ACB8XCQ8_ARCLA|nr:hypothetical protein L6452_43500 [Arctium lappa]
MLTPLCELALPALSCLSVWSSLGVSEHRGLHPFALIHPKFLTLMREFLNKSSSYQGRTLWPFLLCARSRFADLSRGKEKKVRKNSVVVPRGTTMEVMKKKKVVVALSVSGKEVELVPMDKAVEAEA